MAAHASQKGQGSDSGESEYLDPADEDYTLVQLEHGKGTACKEVAKAIPFIPKFNPNITPADWEVMACRFDKQAKDNQDVLDVFASRATKERADAAKYAAMAEQCAAIAVAEQASGEAAVCQDLQEALAAMSTSCMKAAAGDESHAKQVGWQAKADQCRNTAAQCRHVGRMVAKRRK